MINLKPQNENSWNKSSAMQETQVLSLGWEVAWRRKMTTHCSIIAWRIPRTGDSSGWQAEVHGRQTWLTDFHFTSKQQWKFQQIFTYLESEFSIDFYLHSLK